MSTIEDRDLDAALTGAPGGDPELSALVRDVRAEAPAMTPHFAARLDDEVAALPRERRAPRARAWVAPRRLLPVMAAFTVLAATITFGLTAGNGDDEEGSAGGGALSKVAPSSDDEAGSSGSGAAADRAAAPPRARSRRDSAPPAAKVRPFSTTDEAAGAGQGEANQSLPPLSGRRKVERDAQLTLTTAPKDVQDVADEVVSVTQDVDGVVSRSTVDVSDGGGSASFALRIPARRLDDALERLSDLAHVGSLKQGSTDITGAFVSAADRLSDARAERRALLKALGRATTANAISSLRRRIRLNRSEFAALKGDLVALGRRADLATVGVRVDGNGAPEGAGDEGGAWTPGDAARDAVRVLEVVVGVVLVAAAVIAPLALLALLAALAPRAFRRRGREQALDAA